MAAEKVSAQETADIYRLSILSYFNPVAGQAELTKFVKINGDQAVHFERDQEGLYHVDITMPDGSHEYWAQTNAAYCVDTGFKAMGFERREKDFEKVHLESNAPQIMAVFPGSAGTPGDISTQTKIVNGHMDPEYIKDRDDFMARLYKGVAERKALDDKAAGKPLAEANIIVGGHSLGGNAAIGAKPGAKTYLIEPVGAGQTLEYLIDNKKGDPAILADVISVRDSNYNPLHGAGGDHIHDNDMLGRRYCLDTGAGADTIGFKVLLGTSGHFAKIIANALANGAEIIHDPDNDVSAAEILNRQELDEDNKNAARKRAETLQGAQDAESKKKEISINGENKLAIEFNKQTELWQDAKPSSSPRVVSIDSANARSLTDKPNTPGQEETKAAPFDLDAMKQAVQEGLQKMGFYTKENLKGLVSPTNKLRIDKIWGEGTNEGFAEFMASAQMTKGKDVKPNSMYDAATRETVTKLDLTKAGLTPDEAVKFKNAINALADAPGEHGHSQLELLYSGPKDMAVTMSKVKDNPFHIELPAAPADKGTGAPAATMKPAA